MVSLSCKRPNTGSTHCRFWAPLSSPNFGRVGPASWVTSLTATDWFGPGLFFLKNSHFWKAIQLTSAQQRVVEFFPAHCMWSLAAFLQWSAAFSLLLTHAILGPPLARWHGGSWCAAHGPCGGCGWWGPAAVASVEELCPSWWARMSFQVEFLPFSTCWNKSLKQCSACQGWEGHVWCLASSLCSPW